MSQSPDRAQIYLATPEIFDLVEFAPKLARVLDAVPVACLRLSLASTDENLLSRAADTLRELAHARDVAIVVAAHFRMVEPLGLDGVHLNDGAQKLRDVRKLLGQDAIVGAFCGTSRHVGMTAAEIGADYVCFGPLSTSGALGDGSVANPDLFKWWSEMIEVPVVAEGGVTAETIQSIRDHADFVTFGSEIWNQDDPLAALQNFARQL